MVLWRSYDYVKDIEDVDYRQFSIAEMKRTWQFIQEYRFRFLAEAKEKNDFTTEHLIVWEKDTNTSHEKYAELYQLIEWFSKDDYICWRNCISRQSAPLLVHYHIAKFKDIDKEISNLLHK